MSVADTSFVENLTLSITQSPVGSDDGSFDPRVFWGVNCFIIFLLSGMCIWCFCFGGKESLFELTSGETDRAYQETLRQREERRLAARRSTPAQRLARLKSSFQRNKVQMVVKEGDIIVGDDIPGHLTLDNSVSKRTETTRESFTTPPGVENVAVISAVQAMEEGTLPGPQAMQFCQSVTDGDERVTAAVAEPAITEVTPVPTERKATVAATEQGNLRPTAGEDLQKTTTEQDQPTEDDDSEVDTEELPGDKSIASYAEQPTSYLVLRPGNSSKPPANRKMVPNCCAVCLGDYEVGETVVWSCNLECTHAFHLDCIMEWLLKIEDGGTPCPCCRQEFTSWEKDRQQRKIKWGAQHSFDMGAIRL